MNNNYHKIAIFFDWINQWGGAEKVLLNILKIYPQADLYTLNYQPKKITWLPSSTPVFSTLTDRFPGRIFPLFSPVYDLLAESFDFSNYDLVISTTSTIGHCLLTKPNTKFICYYHNVNRRLYPTSNIFLKLYQKIDQVYSYRPDLILCNSKTVQSRINNYLHQKAKIIYPGINIDFFKPITTPTNDYFLCVSRLVKHKNIDQVIKVFNHLPYKLIIVGTGREEQNLKRMVTGNNIFFTGQASNPKLLTYYQNCIALIHPQIEDFGLTSLEAQACGRGVIALNQGGALETVTPQTGILYSINQLQSAIESYLSHPSNPVDCRQQALNFSDKKFMLDFKKTINSI